MKSLGPACVFILAAASVNIVPDLLAHDSLHHLQLIYMPGPRAAIGAALKLPSDNMTGVCQTRTAADIRASLMRAVRLHRTAPAPGLGLQR